MMRSDAYMVKMSHSAFACIASLFEASLDHRAQCSDGEEQDKS